MATITVILHFLQVVLTAWAVFLARDAVKKSQESVKITREYQYLKMLREHFLQHIKKLKEISDRYRAELGTRDPVRKLEAISGLMAEITLVHNLALAGITDDDSDFRAFKAITPMIDEIEKLQDEFREVQMSEEDTQFKEDRLRELFDRIDSEANELLKYIDPANRESTIIIIPRDLSTKLNDLLNK